MIEDYEMLMINKKKKDLKSEFIVVRFTKAEKKALLKKSNGSLSKLVRVNLGLLP